MSGVMLEIKGLEASIDDKAILGIDLMVKPEVRHLGPNGSGKSTLGGCRDATAIASAGSSVAFKGGPPGAGRGVARPGRALSGLSVSVEIPSVSEHEFLPPRWKPCVAIGGAYPYGGRVSEGSPLCGRG